MTAEKRVHAFLSAFGLPVWAEGTVPIGTAGYDRTHDHSPFMTYRYEEGRGDGDAVTIAVTLWHRSPSWMDADEAAHRLSEALQSGGVFYPVDGGAIWMRKGTPWAVRGDDGEFRRTDLRIEMRIYREQR